MGRTKFADDDYQQSERTLTDEELATGDIFNWMLQNDQVSNLLPVSVKTFKSLIHASRAF
jgi:hypothetical protein